MYVYIWILFRISPTDCHILKDAVMEDSLKQIIIAIHFLLYFDSTETDLRI